MRIRACFTLVIGCCAVLLSPFAHSVSACSGPPLSIEGMLSVSDYVVKVHVVDADERGMNTIVRVESYLVGGSGPEHLLLKLQKPVFTRYYVEGFSNGGDCLGSGGVTPPGMSFYVFIKRDIDGSFVDMSPLYTFPQAESTIRLYVEAYSRDNPEPEPELTESQFTEAIQQQSGQLPQMPEKGTPFPLKAPLKIYTESSEYLLPVDWQTPIEITPEMTSLEAYPLYRMFSSPHDCLETDCSVIYSPDGLSIALMRDNYEITPIRSNTSGYTVTGGAALFSQTSDAIAIWDACELSIYDLGYPRLLSTFYSFDRINGITLSAEDCSIVAGIAAWSPDGRLLAYADDTGIWLWDVYTADSLPELMISNPDTQLIPNYFTPLGRFLNYSQGEVNYHLDLVSGETLPDGVMSPDERVLVKFDTNADASTFQICSLTPYQCINPRAMFLRIGDDYDPDFRLYSDLNEISAVQWQDASHFVVLACAPDVPSDCGIIQWSVYGGNWMNALSFVGHAFAYDPQNRALAVLQAGRIIINNQAGWGINDIEVDTDLWFDETIIGIEWLPSLFYFH